MKAEKAVLDLLQLAVHCSNSDEVRDLATPRSRVSGYVPIGNIQLKLVCALC